MLLFLTFSLTKESTFDWFESHSPFVSITLARSPRAFRQGCHCPGNRRKVREIEKGMKWSENFNRLSEHKNFTIPGVQVDDFSFYQNAMSKSHGKFSEVKAEVRENESRKIVVTL